LAFNIRMKRQATPLCGPISATVMDVNDPDNLGRVRVSLVGDPEQAISPWLRVLFPYTSYGGAFLCPKAGEKVLLLHEGFSIANDAYILGSFYFGSQNAEIWQEADGKIAGIATEKTKQIFDDTEGSLSRESTKEMSTADEISISAENEFALAAKQIGSIDGGQNLDIGASIVHINKP
ncbi:MAG: phage baseplate assembly protein V, partial [Bacteroidota bacterium]